MRTRISFLAALLAASATTVQAQSPIGQQQNQNPPTIAVTDKVPGEVTIGVRGSSITGDEARYQRYRDLRDGGFLDRFRWDRQTANTMISLGADHVGYRDQRFFGAIDAGRLKVMGGWDQIPLFFGADTRTPYTQVSPGVFRLDDVLQTAAEANVQAARQYANVAQQFTTRSRRDVAQFGVAYSATRDLDVKFNVTSSHKDGNMPFSAPFAFSNAVELPLPLDNRTTDVSGDLEWANRNGSFRTAYTGSWFDNNIQTLIWDSPLKITDSTASNAYSTGLGTSQGRMALSPSSTLHTISVGGGYRLARRTRLSGSMAVGTGRQNEPLLPFTINTAITPVPLSRPTAEAEVRTTSANLNFSTRPTDIVFISAKYRLYDLNNRTPVFHREGAVQFDQVFTAVPGESEYHSRKTNKIDFDASFTPLKFTAFRIGYGYDHTDRTLRHWEVTKEGVFRVSVDTTGNEYFSMRTVYERSARRGEGLDTEVLAHATEQLTLRNYDIADRDRDRVSAIFTVNPAPQVGINATVGYGKDNYDAEFGLRDNNNNTYSIGFEIAPDEKVGFGLSYGEEKYDALAASRTGSPGAQIADPNRNWTTDTTDKVRTFDASLSLLKAIAKTDVTFGYNWNRSRVTYEYALATPFASPQPLPPVVNELGSATFDVRYYFSRRVALGFGYWYEQYKVDDFALGTETIAGLSMPVNTAVNPTSLMMNYLYRPYTAHTGFVRLVTFF